jgi:hypothetical protein
MCQKQLTCGNYEKRWKLENLKEACKSFFLEEPHIELDQNYPTHIPVEKMIELVFEASKKMGMDSYLVLRDFEFTEEEIKDYFERTSRKN